MTANDIAEAFVAARREARALDDFPGAVPGDLADAYAAQEAALGLDGRPLAGWKVALIRPEFRDRYPAERLAGPIFADAVVELPKGGQATVPVYAGGFAAVEAEFVARIGRDLAPDEAPFSEPVVRAAIAALHVGSEIASSPLGSLNALGPGAVISDHGNNGGAVVGPRIEGWDGLPLESLVSRAFVEGELAGEGSAATVPGGPVAAVTFLANHLAARGRTLRRGDIVLTGMTTGIHEVVPGSRALLEFAGAAPIDLTIAAFRPR